ncbi:MAG: transglycosylase SLT domain-containing protein [Alphaproteobacteria bacterium]|nr:transglycosylase SLT domain-containing protein [Alphaproteobacteria bacterium]MBL6952593.1 transglycosylase SLT domain-containing protein [Alphaproteobacteria bacterium]
MVIKRGITPALLLGLVLWWGAATPPAAARTKSQMPENSQKIRLDGTSESLDCRDMVAAAEARHRIPSEMLAAIALAETGHWLAEMQAVVAWPWTVYAQGKGRHFPDQAAAATAVRALLTQGVRNIDVGCMQVNLQYHPDAFADLDAALSPASNIDYAAGLLRRLYLRHRSWTQAVAHYHSATKALNKPYRIKVMRLWYKERRRADDMRMQLMQAAYKRRRAVHRR